MLRRQVLTAAFAAPAVAAVASSRAQVKAPATSPVQTRDGTSLFIRDWGEGRPVVFVASWALASPMWAYQVAHLSDRGMRCVAFDRRGHGRSGVPRGGYDMDTFADDLAAVVERMGVSDVALVGHSMGCAEILHYLDRHGSRRVVEAGWSLRGEKELARAPDQNLPWRVTMTCFSTTSSWPWVVRPFTAGLIGVSPASA